MAVASMASVAGYSRRDVRPGVRVGVLERSADAIGRALIRWSSDRVRRREVVMESHDRMLRAERARAEREVVAYRRWHLGG